MRGQNEKIQEIVIFVVFIILDVVDAKNIVKFLNLIGSAAMVFYTNHLLLSSNVRTIIWPPTNLNISVKYINQFTKFVKLIYYLILFPGLTNTVILQVSSIYSDTAILISENKEIKNKFKSGSNLKVLWF